MKKHITTAALTVIDPEELSTVLSRYGDFENVQLTSGPFRGQLMRSEFGDSILDMVTYSQEVLVRGSYPQDRITLGLVLSARETGYFNGMRFAVNDILVVGEGVAMDAYRLPAGTRLVGLQASRNRLEREEIDIPERSQIIIHSRLSPEVLQVNQYVKAFVTSQIGSDWRESEDALVIEDDLIAMFRRAIDATKDRRPRVHQLAYRKRQRILRKFEEAIEAGLSGDIRIADLCAHIGISQRTLESFCNDFYGMSPRRYLTTRRLNAVHKQLLHAANTDLSIAAVARRLGFAHLGRFASTYRSLFGELPSHTLRNR